MRAHLRYLQYVIRHKYYVFQGCRRVGVGFWQALIHDWTKFLPAEWGPYVRQFYNPDGTGRNVREPDGSYDPAKQPVDYQMAWLHHQRQKHHWQAWCVIGDEAHIQPLPIPEKYILEMIADWYGAGMAIAGADNPIPWYQANKHKMRIERVTRLILEDRLNHFFGAA